MGIDEFYDAIQIVLRDEGGYVNNPDDPGGETKYGISKRNYPYLDIADLTIDEATAIYKRDYWDNQSYQYINNAALAAKAFDMAVNMGPFQANKLLQRAVGTLSADGVLGPLSLAAINNTNPVQLLSNYKSQLSAFYKSLVLKQPKDKEFLHDWLTRVNE